MGFGVFNNVAISAQYAQNSGQFKKILIVDFDVHHGMVLNIYLKITQIFTTPQVINFHFTLALVHLMKLVLEIFLIALCLVIVTQALLNLYLKKILLIKLMLYLI